MRKNLLTGVAAAALAFGGIALAAPAGALPQCLFQGDWNCQGAPQWNGPLQNTWSHGLTQDPQICSGGNTFQSCSIYAREP
jgi:hypothetical protein